MEQGELACPALISWRRPHSDLLRAQPARADLCCAVAHDIGYITCGPLWAWAGCLGLARPALLQRRQEYVRCMASSAPEVRVGRGGLPNRPGFGVIFSRCLMASGSADRRIAVWLPGYCESVKSQEMAANNWIVAGVMECREGTRWGSSGACALPTNLNCCVGSCTLRQSSPKFVSACPKTLAVMSVPAHKSTEVSGSMRPLLSFHAHFTVTSTKSFSLL